MFYKCIYFIYYAINTISILQTDTKCKHGNKNTAVTTKDSYSNNHTLNPHKITKTSASYNKLNKRTFKITSTIKNYLKY